jgi:hypothetical protein
MRHGAHSISMNPHIKMLSEWYSGSGLVHKLGRKEKKGTHSNGALFLGFEYILTFFFGFRFLDDSRFQFFWNRIIM